MFPNTKKPIPTPLTNQDGTLARVFSSWIKAQPICTFAGCSNTALTAFLCSAFSAALRTAESRKQSRIVLENAMQVFAKIRPGHRGDV